MHGPRVNFRPLQIPNFLDGRWIVFFRFGLIWFYF